MVNGPHGPAVVHLNLAKKTNKKPSTLWERARAQPLASYNFGGWNHNMWEKNIWRTDRCTVTELLCSGASTSVLTPHPPSSMLMLSTSTNFWDTSFFFFCPLNYMIYHILKIKNIRLNMWHHYLLTLISIQIWLFLWKIF